MSERFEKAITEGPAKVYSEVMEIMQKEGRVYKGATISVKEYNELHLFDTLENMMLYVASGEMEAIWGHIESQRQYIPNTFIAGR